jgi:hypothetical protein
LEQLRDLLGGQLIIYSTYLVVGYKNNTSQKIKACMIDKTANSYTWLSYKRFNLFRMTKKYAQLPTNLQA